MYVRHRGIRLPLKPVHSYIALLAMVLAGACPGRGQEWGHLLYTGKQQALVGWQPPEGLQQAPAAAQTILPSSHIGLCLVQSRREWLGGSWAEMQGAAPPHTCIVRISGVVTLLLVRAVL